MQIDVDALNAHVEDLMWIYGRLGWHKRLPDVLSQMETAIDDPRWRAKISYQRAVHALSRDDRDAALNALDAVGPIPVTCDDIDLLQIHVDLRGRSMGLAERLAYIGAIIEHARSTSDKLQYRGAYAFNLLLAGDEAGARDRFDAAIALGREKDTEKPLGTTALLWFCKLLEGRGVIDKEKALLDEAASRLNVLASTPNTFTKSGRAMVGRQIGDVLRYSGRYIEAIEAYREAFKYESDPALRTFEAECELHLGNIDTAFRLIRATAVDKLGFRERADHAFTYFYIALARKDPDALSDARDLLKAAVTPEPYFETLRLRHIVTAQDALVDIAAKREPLSVGPILQALKTLSRYAQLQPNIAGIGINLNNLIDDFIESREYIRRK